jgi:hypothetical protein
MGLHSGLEWRLPPPAMLGFVGEVLFLGCLRSVALSLHIYMDGLCGLDFHIYEGIVY